MTTKPLNKPDSHRRGLLAGIATVIAAGIAGLTPVVASVRALFDPLTRSGMDPSLVLVTRLPAIPIDGIPRRFDIVADRKDAWITYANTPVGAVYLRRLRDGTLHALNVVCPHAGCFVGIAPDRSQFACPCHGSHFAFDGTINDPSSPAPRGMDELAVEIHNGDEVWVRFINFTPGRRTKIPLS